MSHVLMAALASASLAAAPAPVDQPSPPPSDHAAMDHQGMDHGAMDHGAMPHAAPPGSASRYTHRMGPADGSYSTGSGTARLPGAEAPGPAFHLMAGNWMAMLHGIVSAQYTAASGPRGTGKLYTTSMLMGTLARETGWGRVQVRTMLSHEPTLARDGYPNLFATGETAYGQPLVDRQHPHDLVMELSARVDVTVAPDTTLFVYGGPAGEPALGPSMFMMRGSAIYNPEPPIAHHWFDSTHITYGVVTAGVAGRQFQLEASAFRGREPDERRWAIETGKLDSWSVRGTWTPSPRWAIQASYGAIKEPEALHPGENERRFTASAHYADGALSAMAAVSAKRRVPGETLTAWLAEATWAPGRHHALFGRIEHLGNDELFPDHAAADHEHAVPVTKLQAGYARRLPTALGELALGGTVATFLKPARLDASYGRQPVQGTLFLRLRIGR
ncbi:hypothetical protein ACFOON_16600 [Novosphingobium piscinae]|uniref:Porin n=1 Tax=Novosphingobium piscinae TaxID=1507448 RepID=A0A7X1FYN1_9SPHN|nr:hypothetical protein [Novosphingobium piscinae]MBC2669410.1 hypothetical protein [Novosphingobium piscinae]